MSPERGTRRRPRGVQGWMVSNAAMGAGFSAFIALLIPPYVTESTGDPAAAGVVMAVISLAAVLGPVVGTFADRYRAHRLVLCGGVLGLGIGFAAFALSAESSSLYALDAILLGVSVAAISAIGPVLIVGARLSRELEARRMTMFSLAMPAGQVLGGALIGAAAAAGWSYSARFWIAAAAMAVLFVLTVITTAAPVRELHAAMDQREGDAVPTGGAAPSPSGLRTVLLSTFGLFLLIAMLSSTAMNGINSQISNIMPEVYGLSAADTSTLISVAGLLNIVLFLPAGKMMAGRGAMDVYALGTVLRLVAALGMALAGLAGNSPTLVAVAMMQLLYQSNPFARLAQPGTAVMFASFPAAIASGWLIAASAMGSAAGAAVGGALASRYGFNSVNWMGAAAAAASVVVMFLALWPRRPTAMAPSDRPARTLESPTTS